MYDVTVCYNNQNHRNHEVSITYCKQNLTSKFTLILLSPNQANLIRFSLSRNPLNAVQAFKILRKISTPIRLNKLVPLLWKLVPLLVLLWKLVPLLRNYRDWLIQIWCIGSAPVGIPGRAFDRDRLRVISDIIDAVDGQQVTLLGLPLSTPSAMTSSCIDWRYRTVYVSEPFGGSSHSWQEGPRLCPTLAGHPHTADYHVVCRRVQSSNPSFSFFTRHNM